MTVLKTALFIVGAVVFIIFILPVIMMGVLNTGNYIGLMLSAALIIYSIYFSKINAFVVCLTKHTFGKVLITVFGIIFVALLTFVVIITINIIDKANNRPTEPTTVIVLGCRVRESGASTMLKTRLDAAYQYLDENKNVNCILSGGQGKDEPISEAEYMYNWLINKGIEPSRLYIENKSTSTEENLRFSKNIIEENSLNPKITIITNEFHQYRAYRFAKESGFDVCYNYSARTPWYALLSYYVREICGVAHMIFIG
ncbi:MAG: YdcF family protein [Clostridia bacterium]|nr:YdcF family protein [Clostridia bacterium]